MLSATALLLSASAVAEQVCTGFDAGGGNAWLGIDGFSDSNVIAVGNNGDALRFDGSSWIEIPSVTNRILQDVTTTGDLAIAVGRNGTVLTLGRDSSSWTDIGGMTNRHMSGVWAASPSEIWVGGDRELWFWDGSSWSEVTDAAGLIFLTTITDIWGNDDFVYAMSSRGTMHVLNRSTGAWNSPDFACLTLSGASDLWGDASGNVYLSRNDDVYLYNGSSCTLQQSSGETLEGISGSDSAGTVVAVGDDGLILERSGGSWSETRLAGGGDLLDVWVSAAGNAYTVSDSRMLYSCVGSGGGGQPEFIISHDNYGLNCAAETVDVLVRDSASGDAITSYAEEVTLDTQSGTGTWTLVSGGGTLTDAVENDGAATYAWPGGESTATFALYYPEGPATIDVDIFETGDTAVRDTDGEGNLEFSATGFTFTADALSNPDSGGLLGGLLAGDFSVVPFTATQTAGVDFSVHIAAYGQTADDPSCGIIETYSGGKSLDFWLNYQDPASGSIVPSVDGVAVGAGEGNAVSIPVTFSSGQAVVTVRYKDAGRVVLNARDLAPADPELAAGIRGATGSFVVRPADFLLTDIESADGDANPSAGSFSGAAFVAAGESFSATVTAIDAEGDVTPNFGREAVPEGVALLPSLVAPAGGNLPAVTNADAFGPFTAGSASGSSFSWPEVGIITLRAVIADGDYLGTGDLAGQDSGNVGRFTAHHFDTVINAPVLETACSAGGFSYLGQPFGYAVEPEITVTARAATGEATLNYRDGFFRLTGLPAPVYSSSVATLLTGGLVDDGAAAVVSNGDGTATLRYSSGAGLAFARDAETPAFSADVRLSQLVVDTDGAAATVNPVVFGNPGGMLFDGGDEMRYGRVALLNAFGSELVDLPVTMRTEYYLDDTRGFVPNEDDSCPVAIEVSAADFTDNLDGGDTCLLNVDPLNLGLNLCPLVQPLLLDIVSPPLGGRFDLGLKAPGEGNDGGLTVTADVPGYLEYDWDATTPGTEDPVANVTFGIFKGFRKRVFIREVY